MQFITDTGVFSKKEIDFGTRTLLSVCELPQVEGPILDIGCGYGPIGLTLAKEYRDRHIHLVDVNERAIALTRENARNNGVDEQVFVYESDEFSSVQETEFAAILTNPPIRAGKKLVHEILVKSHNHLVSDGELWVVIQKKQGAPSAIKKLETVFEEVEVVYKNKGYFILKATKR